MWRWPASAKPSRVERVELAVLPREMQPLIDKGLERWIGGHPIGLLAEIVWLVWMDGAEHVGVELLLEERLRGVRDHDVAVALRQPIEDRQIVRRDDDMRGVEAGAVESLVRAAWIGED